MKNGILVISLLLVSHCLTGQTIFWKEEWKNEELAVTKFIEKEQKQEDNKLDITLPDKIRLKISDFCLDKKSGRNQINYRRLTGNRLNSTVTKAAEVDIHQPPLAHYERPQGYFFRGLSEGHFSIKDENALIGPAYVPATWHNYSNEASQEFSWSFTNPDSEESSKLVLTERNPTITYGYVDVYPPVLTAYSNNKEFENSYQWYEGQGYISLGGTPSYWFWGDEKPTRFGVGNYNTVCKYNNGYLDEENPDKYLFGTGSEEYWAEKGLKLDAIGNYFEKPLHKYAVEKVWISCDNFVAEPDAELTLIIHRVDEDGILLDTIASSICKGSEAQFIKEDKYGDRNYNIPFVFKKLNPATGIEQEVYLEIEDAIFMELKGFTDEKVHSFAPYFQTSPSPINENNAAAWMYAIQEDGTSERILIEAPDLKEGLYTSFLFNMYLTYPYLIAENDTYHAPAKGGNMIFHIHTYWSPEAISYDKEAFDWIEIADIFNNNPKDDLCYLLITVKPSYDFQQRSAEIKLRTLAADLTLHVIQDAENSTLISESVTEEIRIIRSDNYYELQYPEEIKHLTILNSSGTLFEKIHLPTDKVFLYPTDKLAKGVYIFRFNGEKNHSIKVIK